MAPCPDCGLHHQCICPALPHIDSAVRLALLTHDNEFERATNTGHWLAKSLPHCHRYRWSRVTPPADLLRLMSCGDVTPYLVFPATHSVSAGQAWHNGLRLGKAALFIVLDGTWQEARKMLRKSPWLQTLPQVHLSPAEDSAYRLRRNQETGHLCTLEVGCELLTAAEEYASATALRAFLRVSMDAYQADKSGHALQRE